MDTRKTFRKLATAGAGMLLLIGCGVQPARADHLNFTLYNKSNRPIYAIYVTPVSSDSWGRDVLGRDVLFRGESTRITFPGQNPRSPCVWDIKVVYSDNTTAQETFNLCESSAVYAR